MLSVITVDKALEILKNEFDYRLPDEELLTTDGQGRILSEDIFSAESIPPFDRSTVDGFALISSDTYGAGENMPAMLSIEGEILMGETPEKPITRGECMKISTGGMLPDGADGVIMVEHTLEDFQGICLCNKSISKGENITRKGDDVKIGDKVLEKGTVIGSASTGVLCALGITKIRCVRKAVVGIISTGDEIVDFSEKPASGQIRDINSVMLTSLMRENGCEVINYGIVKDKKEKLAEVFGRSLTECDIVLLSGGSSKGERDMTAEIISERGGLLFHGLSLKPGKPTILGKCDNKAIFGLPGHPAAAYFVALRLVIPFLAQLSGTEYKAFKGKYILSTDIPSNHGREEMVAVKIKDGKIYPVFGKSGLVSLLSESDGYIIIDRNREGIFSGEEAEVYFIK